MCDINNNQNILLLRNLIEKTMSRKFETPNDFECLANMMNVRLNASLSISTLKRIWGYIDGYGTIREKTLNVLSRFVGYPDYQTFVDEYCGSQEAVSSKRLFTQSLNTDDLPLHSRVEIRWNPDRICHLRYMGSDKFQVILSKNSKLSEGDTFKCSAFYLNQPLILEEYVHENDAPCRFIVGNNGGLTLVKRLIDG